jgi:hypothetical protein
MYFLCDFNGRWLKELNLLCYVSILLTIVEGRSIIDYTSKFTPLKW